MSKLLWLIDDALPFPDFLIEEMERNNGWKIEVRYWENKPDSFIDYDRIFILGNSLSFPQERLSLLSWEWGVNPSRIQVFPGEEVRIIFPESFLSILEKFIVRSLSQPLFPLEARMVVPENRVLVLPQASPALEKSLKERGIDTIIPPPSFSLRREGVNFYLSPSGESVGAVIVLPSEEKKPPVSFSSQIQDTLRLVNLEFMKKQVEENRFTGETIIFILPKKGVSEEEWSQVFHLSWLLAQRDRAEVLVLVEEVLVAGEGLEKEYRIARSSGVIFEKVDFSNLLTQPTLDMRGIEVELTTERDKLRQRITANWLVFLPERNILPFDLAPFFRGDKIEGEILPLENPNISPFSSGIEGIFISLPGEEEKFSQVVEQYLRKGMVREIGRIEVDEEKCVLCLTCLRTCPWGAIEIEEQKKKTRINWELCHLCGLCTSFCPAHAIEAKGLSLEDWISVISLGGKR